MKAFCKFLRACSAILLVLVLTFLSLRHAYALDVKLQWDTVFDADHYVVYWRTALQNYDVSRSQNVGSSITYDFSGPDDTYYFVVRAVDDQNSESSNSREICALDPGAVAPYDKGWAITDGDLKGFRVYYNDNAPNTPTLGPSDAIPLLHQDIPDVQGVGLPLNLQPPTDFTPDDVKIFIPCPGYSNVSQLNIYYYDGANWLLANDADEPDIVQPGAVGWMEAGSRDDHNTSIPPTIAIRVLHFSGVQAGVPSGSPGSLPNGDFGREGAGGCFIETAATD